MLLWCHRLQMIPRKQIRRLSANAKMANESPECSADRAFVIYGGCLEGASLPGKSIKGLVSGDTVKCNIPGFTWKFSHLLEVMRQPYQFRFFNQGPDWGEGAIIVATSHAETISFCVKSYQREADNVECPGWSSGCSSWVWFENSVLIFP